MKEIFLITVFETIYILKLSNYVVLDTILHYECNTNLDLTPHSISPFEMQTVDPLLLYDVYIFGRFLLKIRDSNDMTG